MLQHFGTAPPAKVTPLDENLIFAEIEGFMGENSANNVQKDGTLVVPSVRRRKVRPLPVLVAFGAAAVVALVPISLKRGDSADKAAHQAMRDSARSSLSD